MSASNRASQINKLQTLLKKSYKPVPTDENRPLMEHFLYACLLENAPYELADEALARLEQDYFDWNEVRVTTVTELSEVLSRLPDSNAAAARLKKNLHGMFESTYSFDLEELKKLNLGKALQRFELLPSMTPFILAYVTQHGLGGHAIPLDSAALRFFWLCDIITEKELKTGKVTGLERAVPKNKGIEFSSLLHQAAVAINVDPNDPAARRIVLQLNPELDQQLSDHVAAVKKRRAVKAKARAKARVEAAAEAEAVAAKGKKASGKAAPKSKGKPAAEPSAGKAAAKSPEPKAEKKTAASSGGKKTASKKAAPKKSASTETSSPKTASGSKTSSSSKTSSGKSSPKPSSKESSPAKKSKKTSDSSSASSSKSKSSKTSKSSSKSASKRISKRKPR